MLQRKITFTHERSTKNTERFAEIGDKSQHAIGVLYVQRTVFNGSVPTELTVTLEVNG
jgi:hypothetical protein